MEREEDDGGACERECKDGVSFGLVWDRHRDSETHGKREAIFLLLCRGNERVCGMERLKARACRTIRLGVMQVTTCHHMPPTHLLYVPDELWGKGPCSDGASMATKRVGWRFRLPCERMTGGGERCGGFDLAGPELFDSLALKSLGATV